jgi:Zn-dependent M28 family amino/carboxypeptidase
VFATVAGEEQGLYGSAYMAQQMKAAGADMQGMSSNDRGREARSGTAPSPTRTGHLDRRDGLADRAHAPRYRRVG